MGYSTFFSCSLCDIIFLYTCHRGLSACSQGLHRSHPGPPRGQHSLPDLWLGWRWQPKPPGVHQHHERPAAQRGKGQYFYTLCLVAVKGRGKSVVWREWARGPGPQWCEGKGQEDQIHSGVKGRDKRTRSTVVWREWARGPGPQWCKGKGQEDQVHSGVKGMGKRTRSTVVWREGTRGPGPQWCDRKGREDQVLRGVKGRGKRTKYTEEVWKERGPDTQRWDGKGQEKHV